MQTNEYDSWNELLAEVLDTNRAGTEMITIDRRKLQAVIGDLSRLIHATDRRFQETADRLVYEHREQFRQDLINMNNIRGRLNALLRDGQ